LFHSTLCQDTITYALSTPIRNKKDVSPGLAKPDYGGKGHINTNAPLVLGGWC